jgi:hypothetical protein
LLVGGLLEWPREDGSCGVGDGVEGPDRGKKIPQAGHVGDVSLEVSGGPADGDDLVIVGGQRLVYGPPIVPVPMTITFMVALLTSWIASRR